MFKIIFATVLGIASFLSLLLLAFAYRDFSLLLLFQFTFTGVGLCLTTYLLTRTKLAPARNLKHWFVSNDKETGQSYYAQDEDEKETDLKDRFGITSH